MSVALGLLSPSLPDCSACKQGQPGRSHGCEDSATAASDLRDLLRLLKDMPWPPRTHASSSPFWRKLLPGVACDGRYWTLEKRNDIKCKANDFGLTSATAQLNTKVTSQSFEPK